MRNLKYYIKNLAKLSPIASKSVKKCELENSKHRIRQVCLPEMPCNRMHPPFCLYNFYNPYIEKKQPLLFLLLNIEKSLLLKDVLYLRTLYFSISFSYTFRASGLSIGNGFFPMSFESSNQSIFFSSFFILINHLPSAVIITKLTLYSHLCLLRLPLHKANPLLHQITLFIYAFRLIFTL